MHAQHALDLPENYPLTKATPAIQIIENISNALETHPLVIAWSGGKDSTCIAILTLCAALQRKNQTLPSMPVYLLHNDTEVENPVVSNLARQQIEDLENWAREKSLDIQTVISRPNLNDTFVVNILGGGQLPTWPTSRNRVCTHKFKINPARRAERDIIKDLKTRGIMAPLITLTGTRTDESSRRRLNMEKRGEQTGEIISHDGRLMWAPIADWSVTDVFNLLSDAGTQDTRYPVWKASFADIIALYHDAAGECPIVAESTSRKTGCGARFGCATCCAVQTDSSMQTLTSDPRYAFMLPLLKIRDHMNAIRSDWTRRNWLTRQVTHLHDNKWSVIIQPDHFNSDTLIELIDAYLYADHAEQLRAMRFRKALERGEMPDDPYIKSCQARGKKPSSRYLKTMAEVQFRLIDTRKLIALDFYSAMNRKHARPFEILERAYRIQYEGHIPAPLQIPDSHPDTPAPPARELQFSLPENMMPTGIADTLATWIETDSCHDTSRMQTMPNSESLIAEKSGSFDVDEESANLFYPMMYRDHYRGHHRNQTLGPQVAITSYLTMGTISLSPQGMSALTRSSTKRQILDYAGLTGLRTEDLIQQSRPITRASPNQATLFA